MVNISPIRQANCNMPVGLISKNQISFEGKKQQKSNLKNDIILGAGTGSVIGFSTGVGLATYVQKSYNKILASGNSLAFTKNVAEKLKELPKHTSNFIASTLSGELKLNKDTFAQAISANVEGAESFVLGIANFAKNNKLAISGMLAVGVGLIGLGAGLIKNTIQNSKNKNSN